MKVNEEEEQRAYEVRGWGMEKPAYWLAGLMHIQNTRMIDGDEEKVLSHVSLGWNQKVLLIAC